MRSREPKAVSRESGFALIMALLSLLLLTVLGLTLATTTSTELQISTNYRWSQQALYNAEAGLEIGRQVLSGISDAQLILPFARLNPWDPTDPAVIANPAGGTPGAPFAHPRNFENAQCDEWGNGAGYGAVLVDPANPGTPYSNISTMFGQRLNGSFTLWVRREIDSDPGGLKDKSSGEEMILSVEGQAPFTTGIGAFAAANRAIRRLELKITMREGCKPSGPQASQTGFSGCEMLP